MKVKVAEASGRVLDWLMAMCNGKGIEFDCPSDPWLTVDGIVDQPLHSYTPSTDWAQGGPIIEREELHWGFGGMRDGKRNCLGRDGKRNCLGQKRGYWQKPTLGPTPLIAAMRCLVTSRLGEEVEVPDELLAI